MGKAAMVVRGSEKDMYVADDDDGLMAQVAEYCRRRWPGGDDPPREDADCVNEYFEKVPGEKLSLGDADHGSVAVALAKPRTSKELAPEEDEKAWMARSAGVNWSKIEKVLGLKNSNGMNALRAAKRHHRNAGNPEAIAARIDDDSLLRTLAVLGSKDVIVASPRLRKLSVPQRDEFAPGVTMRQWRAMLEKELRKRGIPKKIVVAPGEVPAGKRSRGIKPGASQAPTHKRRTSP